MPDDAPIYLDHNASTPLAPEVVAAMRPHLEEGYGNPSSAHWAGTPARRAVERARTQAAGLLACDPGEIVFTSGGSEANNTALKGVWFALRDRGDHVITTRVEHPATLEPCRWLEAQGARVTYLPVDAGGRVDPEAVRETLTPRTILVSVMHANNEVGTIQPLAEISRACRTAGVLLHTDAAQSAGKIPTRVDALGVDLMSVAGHKLYGPKGIGALYARRGTPLVPLVHGAGHEGGRRAGTESALLTAGFGAACARAEVHLGMPEVRALRDAFWTGLRELFGDRLRRNGHPDECLPNTLHVSFRGRRGADVLAALPGVAASTGSACHSGRIQVSHVLEAMGLDEEDALGAVRWSLGTTTTRAEIDRVLALLAERVDRGSRPGSREFSPK